MGAPFECARFPRRAAGYADVMTNKNPTADRDARRPAGADRPPTPDEERVAEEVAADVDVAEVTAHEKEMAERGAHQEGEGRIP